MQKELPKYLAPRDENPENNKEYKYIPKKIFQTWETNQVSSEMYEVVHTWVDKNPDWEYHFFDKDDRRNFIKNNFSKKVLEAFDALIPGAYKADLFRYCVLYIHGGVYGDIGKVLLTPLNNVLPVNLSFISFKDRFIDWDYDGYIFNAIIMSKPNQPFLKKAIDMIVDYCSVGFYGHNQLCPTGPGLLGKAINLSLNKDEKSPHVPGKHCIDGIEHELWPVPDFKNDVGYTPQGEPFFLGNYCNYRKDLYDNLGNDLSKNYYLCWFFNKVYSHGKVCRPESSHFHSRVVFSKVRVLFMELLYQNGNKSLARKQFFTALKKSHFRFRFVRYLIKYELIYPLSRILRLKK